MGNKYNNLPKTSKEILEYNDNNNTNLVLSGGDQTRPTYDSSSSGIGAKVINTFKFIWALITYYSFMYKTEMLYMLILLVYIIIIVLLFIYNPNDFINPDNKGWVIFLTILGGSLLVVAFIKYQTDKHKIEGEDKGTVLSTLGKFLTLLVSTGLAVAIIYGLFVVGSQFTTFGPFFWNGLNVLIVIGLIAILVKYLGLHGDGTPKSPSENKPSWIKLVLKVLTYIPCLLLDLIDYIKYQYQITTKPIVILFVVEVVLISIYFTYQLIIEKVITHNSNQLLKQPVNLNQETNLGSFQDVNFVNDKFQYKYAVSGWIYIDSFPPETNSKYDEYTSLLNIGNKPNILFNVAKNKLRIKLETTGRTEDIIYETNDFNMQRWNHIIVNYDGSTLDVFINNQLVSSTPGIIPYNGNTMMTAGTNKGIHGGICNVNYFNENIPKGKINWLYNSVKHLNPPII